MALYAIADLHLPIGVNKPMDIFGKSWENYVERLRENWLASVHDDDTVILPGDFSWATYLEDADNDFEFLNNLPGRKFLVKGNHDYWWATMTKMRAFIAAHGYTTIDFLQNNCTLYNGTAICGTRGWLNPAREDFTPEDRTIFDREVIRLRLALDEAKRLGAEDIIVFTHYPPTDMRATANEFTAALAEYGVKTCVYGHLHAASHKSAILGMHGGTEYILVSADYLGFAPRKILD